MRTGTTEQPDDVPTEQMMPMICTAVLLRLLT